MYYTIYTYMKYLNIYTNNYTKYLLHILILDTLLHVTYMFLLHIYFVYI